jgi:hypothetical protein
MPFSDFPSNQLLPDSVGSWGSVGIWACDAPSMVSVHIGKSYATHPASPQNVLCCVVYQCQSARVAPSCLIRSSEAAVKQGLA